MRRALAIIVCTLIMVSVLSTTVLAARPYITLDMASKKIEARYYGSFMQYRATISGKMNKDHEKAYLQTRIYEAGTWRATSTWTCMWGTPIAATTQWVDKINNSNFSAKAYGKNFQDTTYFMTSWTK